MRKKINITILVLCFLVISACSRHTSNDTDLSNDDTAYNEETTNVEYGIPDEFFNTDVCKDENNNYYFFCGRYLYCLDNNNETHIVCDRWYGDNYYLISPYYYDNYLYCTVYNYDKEDENYRWGVGRLDIANNEFEYLFHYETNLTRIYIYDNYIYVYFYEIDELQTRKYALDDYSTYEECDYSLFDRTYFYNDYYSEDFGLVLHVYNNILYIRKRDTTADEYKICLFQYDPATKEKSIVSDYGDGDYIDLLDETWFLFHRDDDKNTITVTLYNLDFSEKTVALKIEFQSGDMINYAAY